MPGALSGTFTHATLKKKKILTQILLLPFFTRSTNKLVEGKNLLKIILR